MDGWARTETSAEGGARARCIMSDAAPSSSSEAPTPAPHASNTDTARQCPSPPLPEHDTGRRAVIHPPAMAFESSSGYVASSSLHDLTDASLPIFNVELVNLKFDRPSDFVAAEVANNVLILAFETGRILRFDLDSPEDIDGLPTSPTLIPHHHAYRFQMSTCPRDPRKSVSFVACSSTRLPPI